MMIVYGVPGPVNNFNFRHTKNFAKRPNYNPAFDCYPNIISRLRRPRKFFAFCVLKVKPQNVPPPYVARCGDVIFSIPSVPAQTRQIDFGVARCPKRQRI